LPQKPGGPASQKQICFGDAHHCWTPSIEYSNRILNGDDLQLPIFAGTQAVIELLEKGVSAWWSLPEPVGPVTSTSPSG